MKICKNCQSKQQTETTHCNECGKQFPKQETKATYNPLQGLSQEPGCCVRSVVTKETE